MKRKILFILLVILTFSFSAFFLTACEPEEPNHTHSFVLKTVEQRFLKSNATCKTPAIYYKSCSCGEKGVETFEDGFVAEHAYANGSCIWCNKIQPQSPNPDEPTNPDPSEPTNPDPDEPTNPNEPETPNKPTNPDEPTNPDPEHTHSFTKELVLDKYLVSNATCKAPAVYYKSCSCGEKGTEPFTSGAISDHVYVGVGECKWCDASLTASEGLEYRLINGGNEYEVVGKGTCTDKDVVIPGVYENKPVTRLGEKAFYCSQITSITIPSTITRSGLYTFENCNSLTKVNFLGTIDDWVEIKFDSWAGNPINCSKSLHIQGTLLEEANITSASKITQGAFYYCASLKSVTISDSVKKLDASAFKGCTSLQSVKIGNGVTEIPVDCFYNCTSLSYLELGASLKSIKTNGFARCDEIKKVNFLGTIDDWAQIETYYQHNSPLYSAGDLYIQGSLLVEANITSASKVSAYAFEYCSSLKTVKLGNSIKSIGIQAFAFCTSLKSVEMPNSITSVEASAFAKCDALQGYTKNGLKYLGNSTNNFLYLFGTENNKMTSATIADTCKFIGSDAFTNHKSLESVEIPNSVTDICSSAFIGCRSLESMDIPKSVTYIGDSAFSGCDSITTIEIPNTVTYLGDGAFASCDGLENITIPDSVTYLGNYMFSGCGLLTYVKIGNGVTSIGTRAFDDCSSLETVELGNNVVMVARDAFDYCNKFQFNVKDGVAYLGNQANKYLYLFEVEDTSKTLIKVDDGCIAIGKDAFMNCYLLENVELPVGLKYINDTAFYSCDKLKSISIPNTVTYIGDGAFRFCSSLKSVDIPDSVTYLGNYVFDCCGSLESIEFSKNIKFIGEWMFEDAKLTHVVIPDGVETIAHYAFYSCEKLESIVIPNSVTSIGEGAFMDFCTSLTTIIFKGTVEEWHKINLGDFWCSLVPAEVINCTNGTVSLDLYR